MDAYTPDQQQILQAILRGSTPGVMGAAATFLPQQAQSSGQLGAVAGAAPVGTLGMGSLSRGIPGAVPPNPMGSMPAFMPNVPMQAAASPAPAIPPMPPHLPDGSLYSPSRNMWKTPEGDLYHADGKRVGGEMGVQ